MILAPRFCSRRVPAVALLAASLTVPAAVSAQDTREEVIAAEQAEKATHLAPRVPNRAERLLTRVKRTLYEQPSGLYPYFDSAYSGGGFTLGVGYAQFFGDRARWDLTGLYSIRSYKRVEATVSSPGHFLGRLDLRARVGWRDATQVAYHGLGIDSPEEGNVAFRLQQTTVGGEVTVRPEPWLVLKGATVFEDYVLEDPTGDHIAVEDVHTPGTAPGVGADPEYLHAATSVGIDTRPAADYARTGGLYELAYHHYGDVDDTYSFGRLDAKVIQHIPVLRETWVVSLRGVLQTTTNDTDQVPYFLMPSLGSGNTLRAYHSWRYRDRHSALTSVEFRWIVSRLAVDMAVFYDAGMVAPRLDQLAFDGFVSNVGVGLRVHGPTTTPLRVEVARGREGLNVVFSGSAAF